MKNNIQKQTVIYLWGTILLLCSCNGKQVDKQGVPASQSDKMIVTTDDYYSPDLGNGYYLNPIIKGDWGDPTILRDGDDYYMTTHTATLSTPSMLVWHSRDLVSWEPLDYALKEDLGSAVWAADLVKYNDLYYLYLPVPNKGTNYVITAPHPQGPWSKAVDVKVSGIDPGHIATPEGKRYLHVDAGYMVELSDNGLVATTEKKYVYEGWQYPEDWVVECFCLESPKLMYKDGWYYLTVAQGGTAGPPTGHMITSSRSRTPYGPWEHSPYNPVVKTQKRTEKWASMGHGTLVDTPQGEWYIVFHAYENDARHMGRQVLMLPVEWTEDGWFRIPEGIDPAKPIRKPKGGTTVKGRMDLSDDFSGETLGLQWKLFGGDIRERVMFADGNMVLKAEGTSPSDSKPVVVDPVTNYYQIEVGLSVEEGTQGGLIFHTNTGKYSGLELTDHAIYRLTGWGYSRETVVDLRPDANVRFRLSNDYNDLLYWYSVDGGENWERIDFVLNLTTWGGATLRPALYATGEGQVLFSDFIYEGIK